MTTNTRRRGVQLLLSSLSSSSSRERRARSHRSLASTSNSSSLKKSSSATTATANNNNNNSSSSSSSSSSLVHLKNFQTQQEYARAIELGKPAPENAWWCYKYFWDPIVVVKNKTDVVTHSKKKTRTDYVLRVQRDSSFGAINSYFPTFVYKILSGYRGHLPKKEYDEENLLSNNNFPWMWMWLRQATSMESWFPTQVPVLAHVIGEGETKRKPPPFSGTPKKLTKYYQLKAKNTMEMTVQGNQLLDYMSANSLLYYSSQSGNDWWSKWPLKMSLKKRRQLWLTIVGLPKEESLLMHEGLHNQMLRDASFVYATDWTFSKKLKKTFLGTVGTASRPDSRERDLVIRKKVKTSNNKNNSAQWVSTHQMKELVDPHVVAPTYFPFPFFNKEASNNPLVVAFVLPAKARNEKAVEELSDIFRFARETNVDVAVCGLQVEDNKSMSSLDNTYDKWRSLQNETVRLTREACLIEWENRIGNKIMDQERAFIDADLDLDATIEALKAGQCPSSKAKEKFDDIAWTFAKTEEVEDKKKDGYLGRAIRFFVQLGFDNTRTDELLQFENFGTRAKVAILDTKKFLNGEMTEGDITSREASRRAKVETLSSSDLEIFPPLTQVEDILRRFRRAYNVAKAKETVSDFLSYNLVWWASDSVIPVGVLRYVYESKIKKCIDELDRAGLSRKDPYFIKVMGNVEAYEKIMTFEEQNLEDMKEKLNELRFLCDDEASPILAQDEEEIDTLIHRVIKANEEASKRFAYFQERDKLSLLPEWKDYVGKGISFADINSRSNEFTELMQMMANRLQKLKDCKELFRAMDENDHFALKNKITEANLPNSVIEKAILRQKELQKAYAQYLKDTRVKRGMSAYMQRYEGEVNAGKSIWYDRKKVLGTGSLGVVVYEGYYDEKHPTTGKIKPHDAAIKRIPLDADSKNADERRQLLRREFEVHRKIASRRITRLFGAELNVHEDDDDSNKAAYVATELCGETLTSWLVNGGVALKKKDTDFKKARQSVKEIPWEERVKVVKQIAVALKEIHASGVAHNDIKADNCLKSRNDEIFEEEGEEPTKIFKISDFGLAKEFDDRFQSFEGTQRKAQSFTSQYGMGPSTVGTGSMQNPLRKPPEELSWDGSGVVQLTPKRDVWDLGCLAFQVLTGAWSPYSSVEIKEDDVAAITRMNHKKREGRYENLNTLLQVANLPRHVQVVSNYLIGKTLHQNPKKRPTSAEFVSMMQLCDPEFCMEQIEDVADRSNPGKVGRAKSLIGDQTTQNLVERAWVGRKADVRRVTDNINNWKDHILSSLLQRSERRRAEDSGSSGSNNARPLTRSQKRRAARERRQKERVIAPDDTNDSEEDIQGDKMETLKVSSASLESLETEIPEDKKQEQLSAGAYSNDFAGLVLCIRNIYTHPPMGHGGEAFRIQREMKSWLSANGAPFVEKPGEDEYVKLERLVALYFVTRFPDAAIIAYQLLNDKK